MIPPFRFRPVDIAKALCRPTASATSPVAATLRRRARDPGPAFAMESFVSRVLGRK
jgi:hypothetical protein